MKSDQAIAIPVSDRRKHERYRVLKAGKIVSSELQSSIDVEIHDMSVAGARIRSSKNINLPASFDLVIVSEGILYPVTARWRDGEWIGVSFDGAPYHLPAGS